MTVSHEDDIYCARCSRRGDLWTEAGLLCVTCYEDDPALTEVDV
jgi:hypothetical protein